MKSSGNVISFCFAAVFFFLFGGVFSQTKYSYSQYKNDAKLEGKIHVSFDKEQSDSAQYYLNQYQNRLGYTYYRLKATLLQGKNDVLAKAYLDSAFRNGMSPACLGKHKKLFDSVYVAESYSNNFLKSFDMPTINSLDSMAKLDQLYRKQMMNPEDIKNFKQFKKPEPLSEARTATFEDLRKKQLKDSLWKLQSAIDSTNQNFLFNLISTQGWPSTKKIGRLYCHRSAPSPWLIIVHIKDLDKNRKTQTEVMRALIPLCEKNEEDWANAEQYMWSIHNRSRKEFHEFSFLSIHHDTLDREASYLSAWQMAESVVKNSTERMEISCRNYALFEQIRDYLLELGAQVNLKGLDWIYKEEGWPLPHHPTKADFVYVPGPELIENYVLFRFVPL